MCHFSAPTWPRWLRRALRNRHLHAIEQASRRWRGGRRGDSAIQEERAVNLFHAGSHIEPEEEDDAALERFLRRRTGAAATDAQRLREIGTYATYAAGETVCRTSQSREKLHVVLDGVTRQSRSRSSGINNQNYKHYVNTAWSAGRAQSDAMTRARSAASASEAPSEVYAPESSNNKSQ